MKSSHRRLLNFTGLVRTIVLEVKLLWLKWTRQRWGNVNTIEVIEWKVCCLISFNCLLLFTFNNIICFLLMRCLGGRFDRAYQGKEDNRSVGAGQEGKDFNEIVERTC